MKEQLEYIRKEIKRIEAQYGNGVRPSWVSTELAILYRDLKELEDATK